MGLFDNILHDNESLFLDEIALDYDYVPKQIPFRENQQQFIAECIAPLLQNKTGRNLFIQGAPGIGKTLAALFVKRELEEKTGDVKAIYINCWKKDSSYKILLEICNQIGYKWTQNKRTDELMDIAAKELNKGTVVLFLDEIDKVREVDILYSFCEDLLKKSLILIANNKEWLTQLDDRVKSRLMPELLEFNEYNAEETAGIMKERVKYAFVPNVWDQDAMQAVINKTIQVGDIRSGLFLLRESGNSAEARASRKILIDHAHKALTKLESFKIKNSLDFGDDEQTILDLIKQNSGKTVKELHSMLEDKFSYRTFHRKIDELKKNHMLDVIEVPGKSSIVNYSKKLTEF
ncbi:AAA family ATPase [Candidatus Woesearchaeota archaeon]|jgi:archaeal cell division control protein 6|nr:AAA family ATPase [Candidatus Woesearchaeota archaeon]MBT7237409.1 AAA family ATPase [Candidatus Woesearchaeota archaeon]